MTEQEMVDVFCESACFIEEFDDQCVIDCCISFEQEGVLTQDAGFVIMTEDDDKFYITVKKQ